MEVPEYHALASSPRVTFCVPGSRCRRSSGSAIRTSGA